MKPKYQHYCKNCRFIGEIEGGDAYVCPGPHYYDGSILSPRLSVCKRTGDGKIHQQSITIQPNISTFACFYTHIMKMAIDQNMLDKMTVDRIVSRK